MSDDIKGGLDETRCSEIIKILSLGKRSGRLFLNNGADTGNIFFREGEIIHAQCGPLQGLKAIYELVIWTSGEYRFDMEDSPDVVTVNRPVNEILSEAADRIRQMDRVTSLIPSSSAVYELDPDIKEKEITFKSIQWKVLAHVNGKRSISDIAQRINLGVSDTMKVFYTLIKAGLLRDADVDETEPSASMTRIPETTFMKSLSADLAKAIGPVAPFVILETASEMGFDLLSDDTNLKAALVETISSKIPDEKMSLQFLDTMTDWINAEGE